MSSNYENLTREAYRDKQRAHRYNQQFAGILSWARIAMARELKQTQKIIQNYSISEDDLILDVPCGTGIAGPMLANFPARTLAIDISSEMMEYAGKSYSPDRLAGFIQADVTSLPFPDNSVTGVIVLGFMHRVPMQIKASTLRELARVSKNFLVVSVSIDSFLYRLKRILRKYTGRLDHAAPAPCSFREIVDIAEREGLKLCGRVNVVRFLSSEVILWMEKK